MNYFRILIALFLLFVPHFANAQDIAERTDKYLTAKARLGRFSGSVLIAKNGRVLLRKGYGLADVERRIVFAPETKFHAASITKMFTAMAILQLRDDERLALDDLICKYTDPCPDAWRAVTLEHLIRHRSGIPDYEEALELGSEKFFEFAAKDNIPGRVIEFARDKPLDFAPGEKFKYSNTGYILLSRVIEQVSGQKLADYFEKRIFGPAGMSNSGMLGGRKHIGRSASGYTHGSLPWDKFLAGVAMTDGHLKKVPEIAFSGSEGDAAMYTNVDDLYRWTQIMDGGGKVVSERLAAEVFAAETGYYGFGWFILEELGRKKLWHNGQLPGFVTDVVKFPDDRLTIILVTNIDRARLSVTTRDVTRLALGLPADMPVKGNVIKLTAEQIAAIEGDYKTADGSTLKVKNEPDYMTGYMNNAKGDLEFIAGWIPISPTEFYFPLRDGRVTFVIGKDGRADSAVMHWAGADHPATRVVK